jgi:sugar phosphate isomerase/epimerase
MNELHGAASDLPWPLGVYSKVLFDKTPTEVVHLVKAAGYAGVEWRVADIPTSVRSEPASMNGNNLSTLPPSESAGQYLRALCDDQGLGLMGLTAYFGLTAFEDIAVSRALARRVFEMAGAARAPFVRVGAARYEHGPYQPQLKRFAGFLNELIDMAEANGTKIALFMHYDSLCPSASLTERLVSNLDPARIGIVFDAGNMAIAGYEDYRIGLELLRKYLLHVYIKNVNFVPIGPNVPWHYRWGTSDDGVVDIPALLSALRWVEYSGWLSVSDFSERYCGTDLLERNRAQCIRAWSLARAAPIECEFNSLAHRE